MNTADLKVALMEMDNSKVLKNSKLVKVKRSTIKPSLFGKGKRILSSNALFKLEEEATKMLKKGYEVLEPVSCSGWGYSIIFSHAKNKNSLYLKRQKVVKMKK